MGDLIKISRTKRLGTPESARKTKCIVHAVKIVWTFPSTESSFSVQTSRVAGRLLFHRIEHEASNSKSHRTYLCRSLMHEQSVKVGTSTASFWERKRSMVAIVIKRQGLKQRLCSIDMCHWNRSAECQSETFARIANDSDRRQELRIRKQWLVKVHLENLPSIRAFSLWTWFAVYGTSGFETSLELIFFCGHQAGLDPPNLRWAWTLWAP